MSSHAGTDHALQVVMFLAGSDRPAASARQIATALDISQKYVEHIIAELRRANMVRSREAGRGGYRLAVPPDELSVAAVANAVRPSHNYGAVSCTLLDPVLEQLWCALDVEIQDFLDAITIADLVTGELPAWARQLVVDRSRVRIADIASVSIPSTRRGDIASHA